MTKRQFVSNNRGIDKGADLPRAFLEYLYDAIANNEIRIGLAAPVSAAGAAAAAAEAAAGAALPPLASALFGPALALALAQGPDATGETDAPTDAPAFLRHLSNGTFK